MGGDRSVTRRSLVAAGAAFLGSVLSIPVLIVLPAIYVGLGEVIFGLESSTEAAVNAVLLLSCTFVPLLTGAAVFLLSSGGSRRLVLRTGLSWLGIVALSSVAITVVSLTTPPPTDDGQDLDAEVGSTEVGQALRTEVPPATATLTTRPSASLSQSLTLTPSLSPSPTYTPTTTSTPSRTPTPTVSATPTKTTVPTVGLNAIYDNFESMTELQFSEYTQQIVGRPVRQSVTVGNVSDDGKISLSGPWSPWLFNVSDFCVVVTGAPRELALGIDGGETVFLEAIVNGIVGNYNYYINCENTLLLSYREIR